MQDPFLAVKEEVEHSVEVVVNLHKKWLDLAASASHGDEFEWTSSELLSGLRSIEWDLQDLEDTVSIVESNRQKFQLDEAELLARKDFIESTRQQVTHMREEVQSGTSGEGASTGCATSKGSAIMGALQGKGYGSVATGEEDLTTDIEMNGKPQHDVAGPPEEILGMDTLGMPAVMPRRHTCKKICLCVCCLLLAVAIFAIGGGFGVGAIPTPG